MKKSIIRPLTLLLLLVSSYFAFGQQLPDLIPFKEDDLYGYCDSNLNVLIEAQYQNAYPFVEGRGRVIEDNLNGFIDNKGSQIIPCIYRYAGSFLDGFTMVKTSNGEKKYIDREGKFISNPEDKEAFPPAGRSNRKNLFGPIKEGRYFYQAKNYTEGYMTIDGDTISSSEYTYPYYSECYSTSDKYDQTFRHFYESRAIVSGKEGQGYIDLEGHLVIDTVFDVAFNFKEGRAKVKLNGKYGFIDQQGQIIGEIKYDQVCYFYDGMAQVISNGKCGYINLEGEEVIPLIYDYWQGERYSSFKNGLVRIRMNEQFGILDKKGKEVTDVKYDNVFPFFNGRAIVLLEDKMGLIDENGNELIPPIYDRLNRIDAFAFTSQMDQDERVYELINCDGKILAEPLQNRPAETTAQGVYQIVSSTDGYYFIDHYGTRYLK